MYSSRTDWRLPLTPSSATWRQYASSLVALAQERHHLGDVEQRAEAPRDTEGGVPRCRCPEVGAGPLDAPDHP